MKTKDLKKWLRDNSSGIYRPSKEAADYIDELEKALRFALDNIGQPKSLENRDGIAKAEKLLSN
jgi:hypothetical protein